MLEVGWAVAISPGELIGIGGVPVIVGLVEVVKRAWPRLPARFYPVLALAFGVAVNLALRSYSGAEVTEALLAGIVAALVASGLYSQARALSQKPAPEQPLG